MRHPQSLQHQTFKCVEIINILKEKHLTPDDWCSSTDYTAGLLLCQAITEYD